MRSSSFFIAFLFLIVKMIQLMGGFALAHIFGSEQSSFIMMGSLVLLVGMFIVGVLVKKFLSPTIYRISSIILIPSLIALSFIINPLLPMTFLGVIFFFILMSTEARVMQTFSLFKNIPQYVTFLIVLLPLAISYLFPQMQVSTPLLFYVISSGYATLVSYMVKPSDYDRKGDSPPIWIGFGFLIFSGLIYFVSTHSIEGMTTYVLSFVLLFYAGGTTVVYLALDGYLRRWKR